MKHLLSLIFLLISSAALAQYQPPPVLRFPLPPPPINFGVGDIKLLTDAINQIANSAVIGPFTPGHLISGGPGTTQIQDGGGTVFPTGNLLGFTPAPIFNVKDYGAVGNGTTDDTTAINAALTACGTAGGGHVYLQFLQYKVSSGNITIPQGCTLGNGAWVGDERLGSPSNNMKAVPALLLNPSFTVSLNYGSAIDGLAVFNNSISPPTSLRTAIQGVANFSGTAITVPSTSGSTSVNNVYVVGFALCYSNLAPRFSLSKMRGDCTAGIFHQNTDAVSYIDDIEFWPFYEQNNGFGDKATYSVTAASACVVTIGAGSQVQNGDVISIYQVGGYKVVNNRWTVQSIDGSGNITLSGCADPPTVTGTWGSGDSAITVSSTNSLALGQGVSGTNIAGGSTITNIDWITGVIYLSAPTTGSGSGTSLTISNGSYTSGGTVRLGTYRTGKGINISQANEMKISHVLDEEHDIGIYLKGQNASNGAGMYWAKLIDVSCDTDFPSDPTTVCMYWDNDGSHPAMGETWIGGYTSSVGLSLYANALNATPASAAVNIVSGVHFGGNPTTATVASIQNGSTILTGVDYNSVNVGGNGFLLTAPTVNYLGLNGNDFSNITLRTACNTCGTATHAGSTVFVDWATLVSGITGIAASVNVPNTFSAGPFTPTLLGDGTAGAPTYTIQVGTFERVGRQVTVRFSVKITAQGGMAGNLEMALPIGAANVTNDYGSCNINEIQGWTADSGYTWLTGIINPGTSVMQLLESGSAHSTQQTPLSDYGSTVFLTGWCNYHT